MFVSDRTVLSNSLFTSVILPYSTFALRLDHTLPYSRCCTYLLSSSPTSEAGVRFPARPQVGKLVVACRWSAVYSTEP